MTVSFLVKADRRCPAAVKVRIREIPGSENRECMGYCEPSRDRQVQDLGAYAIALSREK